MHGLWTKCEVKMAGYWPSSFFLASLRTETESRSISSQKKRTRPIFNHLDRTNVVNKDLLYDFRGNFSCGTRRLVPSGQDSFISARSGGQSQRRISFILPAHGASHLTKSNIHERSPLKRGCSPSSLLSEP